MNLAPPIPRFGRPADRVRGGRRRALDGQPDAGQEPRRRRPPRAPPGGLRDPGRRRRPDRARHPDGLLVVRAQGLPVAGRRHVRDGRAADPVGDPRDADDGGDDADRLPLPAARVGAVLLRGDRAAGARLRAPVQHRRRRLGSLAQARPVAGDPPGRDRQAGAGHLPRPLAGQARRSDPWLLVRDRPVPAHRRADHRAGLQGAGPGHDRGHHDDRLHDVLRGRREPRSTWR